MVSLLWCMGGAGIYGSPIAALGSEGVAVLLYLVATAGSSFLAALVVNASPKLASRILATGAAFGCVLGGRYLFAEWAEIRATAIVASFGIPAFFLFLGYWVRSTTGCSHRIATEVDQASKSQTTTDRREFKSFQISLCGLLLCIAMVAMSIAFGKVSQPPSFSPNMFTADIAQRIPTTMSERYAALENAREDFRSILLDRYEMKIQPQGGFASGYEEKSRFLVRRANWTWRGLEQQNAASTESQADTLLDDLRAGLKHVMAREGVRILNEIDHPGHTDPASAKPGFTMLYRNGDRKGLIQATDNRVDNGLNYVRLSIHERAATTFLTLFPERYQAASGLKQEDWSEYE
ncbi:hypothetical protein [Crateriforma conspicua]|uniref:hypothetical protein n=1 Tax=Crateriforma conspicua TaxID=2527996 RepID=UPI0018CD1B67|nr:hypothetical protein [Crateriforma conspicua]